MTKDTYFEMCDALGSEPIESEIPITLDDLATEIQQALSLYNMLQDNVDYMNGVYIGKIMTGILDIFSVFEIPIDEYKHMLELIILIDRIRIRLMNSKKPQN